MTEPIQPIATNTYVPDSIAEAAAEAMNPPAPPDGGEGEGEGEGTPEADPATTCEAIAAPPAAAEVELTEADIEPLEITSEVTG